MKKIFSLFIALAFSVALFAQNPTGTWSGTLNIPGGQLPLIIHISGAGSAYSSTMDSPNQNAFAIPLAETTFQNNTITITASNMNIKYSGILSADQNKITGTYQQGQVNVPLVLSRKKSNEVVAGPPARPQDPKDFPYKQEEVTFTNAKAGNTLSGTLTFPQTGKFSKVVVLISGSGPQNRNEEVNVINHRPFLVLSDYLTRNGIAVLRYDDRGIGKSTGDFNAATTADFADDAEAAVNYIQSRPDLKQLSIGLIGHSEGGIIAPMIASRNKAIHFVVLEAGPGVPSDQLMLQQAKDIGRLGGLDDKSLQRAYQTNKKIYDCVKQSENLSWEAYLTKLEEVVKAEIQSYTKEQLQGINTDDLIQSTVAGLKSPWIRYFLSINPDVYLSRLSCPVLALNGTLDMQVASTPNLAGIKASLEKAKNKRFEIVPMPDLNHMFQKAKTGGPMEYATIEETINPAALQKIATWINGL
jgi:pimeloyl-ACP methyl ester carboxylesterase